MNQCNFICISFLILVISCKPQFPSYMSALLPQDQIFEPEPDFQFESTPVKKKKEQQNEETEESKPLFLAQRRYIYIIKNFFLTYDLINIKRALLCRQSNTKRRH